MLSSTTAYLIALRNGDYLRFLEWPDFVEAKYRDGDEKLGADMLMDCLIFEWLKAGYYKKDIKKIAVLYALYELNPSPIQAGKYAFALMTISSVLFSCMVFDSYQISNLNKAPAFTRAKEVFRFMDGITNFLNQKIKARAQSTNTEIDDFNKSLTPMRDDFMKEVSCVDVASLGVIANRVENITRPLSILEEYRQSLDLVCLQDRNELFPARVMVVQGFYSYLKQQSELTDKVAATIINYVNTIRGQAPAEWEEKYLQKISPLTLLEKAFELVSYLGSGLFTLVQTPTESAKTKSESSCPQQPK